MTEGEQGRSTANEGGASTETDAVWAYGPSRAAVITALGLGLVLAYLGLGAGRGGDHPGLALLGGGAFAVLVAAGWALLGPMLRMDAAGVTIRQPLGRTHYAWAEIQTFTATSHRRRGLPQRNLEIEAGDRLHLIPDWLLGGELTEIVATATALRSG